MSEILCSTGALIGLPNGRNYRLLESLSKQLSCDGFEFMMYNSWYGQTEELVAALKEMNLYTPIMHCEKHIGESISKGGKEELRKALQLFEINCRIATSIQARKLVIHLWDGITSDQNFANNISTYAYLADMVKDYGIDLLVENVVCNHENPMKHWCELAEKYPNIHFVFDTKMAAFHNQLDLLYREDYAWLWKDNHICHYHVNDYGGGYMDWGNLRTLSIGKGNIDFDRFFEFIHKIHYNDTFTVEATMFDKDGNIDVDTLNGNFAYIRRKLGEEK